MQQRLAVNHLPRETSMLRVLLVVELLRTELQALRKVLQNRTQNLVDTLLMVSISVPDGDQY